MRIFWVVCGVAIAHLALAQLVEVSPPTRLNNKIQRVKIIGKNQDGYVVRFSGDEETVHVYGNELRLKCAKNIDYKNRVGELQHILLNKNGANVFYLTNERRQTILMAQPVNGKFVETGNALAIDSFPDKADIVNANLHYRTSLDQNYTLFYYPVFRGAIVESMQLTCIDRSLQVIYRHFLPIGRPEKDMEFAKALVDNSGNSLLIFAAETKGIDRTYGDSFDVQRYDRATETETKFRIGCAKEIFGEPMFELDNKNHHLIFTAFFDEKGLASDPGATGFFYQQYDTRSGEKLLEAYKEFPAPFITELTGREVTNMNKRLYTFMIKKVVPRQDGGVFFAAESFIRDRREVLSMLSPSMMMPYNAYRTINTFSFNDIIAFSLGRDGTIEWCNILRKKQLSEEDGGYNSSFAMMNQRDRLRFIFLDEVNSSASVNEYELTSDGKQQRNNLFNQEDKDVLLVPKLAKQVAPDEILFPSIKANTFRLVKITY